MPKTPAQNKAIREKRRNEIMNAALILFSKHGFDNVSVSSINKKAKISHGLFYHYFENKQDVLFAILRNESQTNLALQEIIELAKTSPYEGVSELTIFISKGLANKKDNLFPHEINLFLSISEQKTLQKLSKRGKRSKYEEFNEIIAYGQQLGEFRSDILSYDLALIYGNYIKGLVRSRIYGGAKSFKAPSAESLMKLLESRGLY